MEVEMMLDYMLNSMLSDLSDAQKTMKSIQLVLEFMVSKPAVAKLVAKFVADMRDGNRIKSMFRPYEKRILLFLIVECAVLGQDLEYSFASDTFPLEFMIERLNDIYKAFESSGLEEYILDVWIQTVKQAIFSFLRHGRTVRAAQILVIYRHRVIKEHQEILKNYIDVCSGNPSLANEVLKSDGHDYMTYYFFVSDLAEELNRCVGEPTMLTLAKQINTSLTENIPPPDSPEIVDVEVEASEHSGHRSDETFIDVEVQIPDARSTEARHPQNDGGSTTENNSDIEESMANNKGDEEEDMIKRSQGIGRKRGFVPSDSDSDYGVAKRNKHSTSVVDQTADVQKEVNVKQPRSSPQTSKRDDEEQTDSESDRPTTSKNILYSVKSPNPKHAESDSDKLSASKTISYSVKSGNTESDGDRPSTSKKTRYPVKSPDPEHTESDSSRSNTSKKIGDSVRSPNPRHTEPDNDGPSTSKTIRDSVRSPSPRLTEPDKDRPSTSRKNLESVKSPNPRHSLTYRIREQKDLGILIPCKNIISLCQKVHNEDKREETSHKVVTNRGRTSTPVKSTHSALKSPRGLHLGDRFDVSSAQSMLSTRSYAANRQHRNVFTLDHDSYIVAGCIHLEVGRWRDIVTIFPFPPSFTNVNIKDRYRTLIKRKIIENKNSKIKILDPMLKNKMPTAENILEQHLTEKNEATEESSEEAEEPPRPQKKGSGTLSVMSMSSKSDEVQSENEGRKFTTKEDAYLICGMRNFGFRWGQIRENFDFDPTFTSQDLSARWRYLSNHKMVTLNEDGELCCRNMKLKEECQKASKELKRRIKMQRKRFDMNMNQTQPDTAERQVYEVELNVERQTPDKSPTLKKERRKKVKKPRNLDAKQKEQVQKAGNSGDGRSLFPVLEQRRRKLASNSPSMFGETSDSPTDSDGIKSVPGGTSIRPSKLNTFKTFSVRSFGTSKPKPHKVVSSSKLEIRSRRQKKLSREQRIRPGSKNPWTKQEVDELLAGLSKHGPGNWALILDDGWDIFRDRTSVMIKDKFRNMMKNNELPDELVLQWDAMKAARE